MNTQQSKVQSKYVNRTLSIALDIQDHGATIYDNIISINNPMSPATGHGLSLTRGFRPYFDLSIEKYVLSHWAIIALHLYDRLMKIMIVLTKAQY